MFLVEPPFLWVYLRLVSFLPLKVGMCLEGFRATDRRSGAGIQKCPCLWERGEAADFMFTFYPQMQELHLLQIAVKS